MSTDMATAILSTVTKASRLLELFHDHSSLNLAECAQLMGIPRPSAHRLLVTLESTGLIERTPGGRRYELGLRMFEMGAAAPFRRQLYDASCHAMEQLVDLVGLPAHLTMLDGRDVVYLAKAHRVARDRTETRAGCRRPAHATAAGKVLLAFLDHREAARFAADGLVPVTRHTQVVPALFLQELATARENGFAVEREEVRLGCASIAAPVRGRDKVEAALSIDGPIGQLDRMLGHERALQQAAREVTLRLQRIRGAAAA